MRKVVILGTGMSNFGIHKKSAIELFIEASIEALEKSRLSPKDIEALFLGNCLGGFSESQLNMASFLHSFMGLNFITSAWRFEAACATATVAFRNAVLLVGSGVYDIVLAGGTEKVSNMSTKRATTVFAMASHAQYEIKTGVTFPGIFAMAANMYSNKYKISLLDLKKNMAEVSVKNHYHGKENNKAHLRKIIAVDDVLKSVVVSDPLQLLDCCPFSDGAAAVVIASYEKVKFLVNKPVSIIGMGQSSSGMLSFQKDLTISLSRNISIKMAYSEAGITPKEVDVCELHDCFSIAEILAIEALGFYEFGKGFLAASKRETYINTDKVVINSSGGLKSRGHAIGATGIAQIIEIVEQLRGQSGKRQVKGAKIGLVDTMGGGFGTVCNIILKA